MNRIRFSEGSLVIQAPHEIALLIAIILAAILFGFAYAIWMIPSKFPDIPLLAAQVGAGLTGLAGLYCLKPLLVQEVAYKIDFQNRHLRIKRFHFMMFDKVENIQMRDAFYISSEFTSNHVHRQTMHGGQSHSYQTHYVYLNVGSRKISLGKLDAIEWTSLINLCREHDVRTTEEKVKMNPLIMIGTLSFLAIVFCYLYLTGKL